jgi:hypothetical protein
MKRLFGLLVFCLFPGMALAQVTDCRSISSSIDRLACYDKISPPTKPPPSKSTVKPAESPYIDDTANEDARMKKLLKPICKNC